MYSGNMRVSSLDEPATEARAVTTSDTVDLTQLRDGFPRRFYVGVAGDITLVLMDDTTVAANGVTDTSKAVLLKAVAVGILNVRARRIMATGTAATNIIALY